MLKSSKLLLDNAYRIISQQGGCDGIHCGDCPAHAPNNPWKHDCTSKNSKALKISDDYVKEYASSSISISLVLPSSRETILTNMSKALTEVS